MLFQRLLRTNLSKRNFMKSAIRRDDHDLGGEPGKVSILLRNSDDL